MTHTRKALRIIAVAPYYILSFVFLITADFACKVQRLFDARMTDNYEDPFIAYDDRSLGSLITWSVLGYLGWLGRGIAIGIFALVIVRVLHWARVVSFDFITLNHTTEVFLAFVMVCTISGPAVYFGYSIFKVLLRRSRTVPNSLVKSKLERSLWLGVATAASAFGIWFASWSQWWDYVTPPDTRTRIEQLQDEAQDDANNRWTP